MRWEKERFKVIARVRDTLHRWQMVSPGDLVLVAVSGGADSLVLLDVMAQLAAEEEIALRVVHVDHGLRLHSEQDAALVERVAAHYGLPCRVIRVEVPPPPGRMGMSPEEAAREARYGAFARELEATGAARLATGHSADDRVETLVFRLLAGSGPRGLRTIPPVRGPFVRPLIRVWRREVEAYARLLPVAPCLDRTNLDLSIPRNRVRHRLIPLLAEEYNPSIRQVLLREAEALFDLGELVERLAEEAEEEGVTRTSQGTELELDWLLSLPLAVRRATIARCLRRLGVEAAFDVVEDIVRRLPQAEGSASLDLGPGLVARKVYGRLILGPRPPRIRGEETVIPGEGRHRLAGLGVRLEVAVLPWGGGDPREGSGGPSTAWLDADRLSFPLTVRGVRPGDRFHPLGAPGRRKLQDFLVDLKVPREERERVAVLESGGDIAWVLGLRIDERFKVREDTGRVAVLSIAPDETSDRRDPEASRGQRPGGGVSGVGSRGR